MRVANYIMLGVLGLAGCGGLSSTTSRMSPSDRPAADNSAVNQRDTQPGAVTPINQNENEADVKTTADIRKRVLEEPDMSVNGRNCKIITADGKVTLRGPVESLSEKDVIARIATAIAGDGNVDNQLEVKP